MLSLRVAIGPGIALLILLIIATARIGLIRYALLVDGLDLLLIRVWGLLPLLVLLIWIVGHCRFLPGFIPVLDVRLD